MEGEFHMSLLGVFWHVRETVAEKSTEATAHLRRQSSNDLTNNGYKLHQRKE